MKKYRKIYLYILNFLIIFIYIFPIQAAQKVFEEERKKSIYSILRHSSFVKELLEYTKKSVYISDTELKKVQKEDIEEFIKDTHLLDQDFDNRISLILRITKNIPSILIPEILRRGHIPSCSAGAYYNVALLHYYGLAGIRTDTLKWLQKAANLGHVDALHKIGHYFQKCRNDAAAFEYYVQAMEKGCDEALEEVVKFIIKNWTAQEKEVYYSKLQLYEDAVKRRDYLSSTRLSMEINQISQRLLFNILQHLQNEKQNQSFSLNMETVNIFL